MKQLDLLTIRKQPLQPEPKIPSRVIKAYVRENLRGFARRQSLRERTRQEYRERETTRKPRTEQRMRTIKVTYRAIFVQPLGLLNPMGLKLSSACPIELFRTGNEWQARELITAKRNVYQKFGKFASLDNAQAAIERSFETMKTPWQIWGTPPLKPSEARDVIAQERQLTPSEICDLRDGTAGWYTAEDRTHIIHISTETARKRLHVAACGAELPEKCFINNRANVEPSCPECAEVWRREYKDR